MNLTRRIFVSIGIVVVIAIVVVAFYAFPRPAANPADGTVGTSRVTSIVAATATMSTTASSMASTVEPAASNMVAQPTSPLITATTSVISASASSAPASPLATPVLAAQTSPLTLSTGTQITSPLIAVEIGGAPVYTYTVVHVYPHDPTAFTEGLEFVDGVLYEGTGLRGHSSLRKVDLATGKVLQEQTLAEQYFGEGVTVVGDKIYQLTWQAHTGFVYDLQSFKQLSEFSYTTEGWGLTHDDQHLIMSDGTSTLYVRDPVTFAEIGRVEVHDADGPVVRLNELEYAKGEIFANVWQTDYIVRIAPETGVVTGWIDLSGLLGPADRTQPVDVLNGIAYDAAAGHLFVTGKLWPKLFEIMPVAQLSNR